MTKYSSQKNITAKQLRKRAKLYLFRDAVSFRSIFGRLKGHFSHIIRATSERGLKMSFLDGNAQKNSALRRNFLFSETVISTNLQIHHLARQRVRGEPVLSQTHYYKATASHCHSHKASYPGL